MAYASPRTWTTAEMTTAAMLNQDVRDNLLAAFPLGVDAWTAYTPSNTNITVGNGIQVARYQRIGRLIHVMYDLLWGSTTSYAGAITVGAPVAAAATGKWIGTALFLDANVNDFPGVCRLSASASSISPVIVAGGGVSATAPFTWVNTDRLTLGITYEALS